MCQSTCCAFFVLPLYSVFFVSYFVTVNQFIWFLVGFPEHTHAHVPVLWNTPGLQRQYRWANASIMRSIFWASPGSLKLHRNCLRAWTRFRSVNSCNSRKACRTSMLKSSLHDTRNPTQTHTPTCTRTRRGVSRTKTGSRTECGSVSLTERAARRVGRDVR